MTDREILAAYRLLAREGLFGEPASRGGRRRTAQEAAAGALDAGQVVVCTFTGNGLKDPQWAIEAAQEPVVVPVDAGRGRAGSGLAAMAASA